MAACKDMIRELVEKTVENNLWRQRKCVNLIPSENTPSLFVKLLEMSDPSGRYAEHKTALKKEREAMAGSGALKGDQIYYYQGTEFIYEVEEKLKAVMAEYLGASDVETRVISGQMANEVVFKSLVKFLSKGGPGLPALTATGRLPIAMNNALNSGGHLSAQPFGALFNFLDGEPVAIPLEKGNFYKVDVDAMLSLVDEKRPPIIIFGKSVFLHPEPVKALSDHLKKTADYNPVVMYDGAHVLGILGPCFQDPLKEGAHIVTGSTHKTFFGPQRGVVGINIPADSPLAKLANEIHIRTFPGSTSNHHLGTQLALLGAALEMKHFRDEYQKAVTANARSFAKYLNDKGIPVEGGESEGFTHTHQVVIRVKKFGDGKDMAVRLEKNNIIVNFQALPDDETFYHPSGIRMGVQEMTRFGMQDKDFEVLASLIAGIIIDNTNSADEVVRFRAQFSKMRYTFPFEETKEMLSAIFRSVFSDSDYFDDFAETFE
jgi:glycine/serine hydroxymethyltransferase